MTSCTQCILNRFNTQPPEGGWIPMKLAEKKVQVSTHSRPKAAGVSPSLLIEILKFQHTAARRRLAGVNLELLRQQEVSTHSRPKAAG